MSASAANLALLCTVASRLGPLRERVVFLGGATIALLITDADGIDIRATNDVDVIIDGRPSVVEEVKHADETLRNYLAEEFAKLLDMEDFVDAIPAHLLPDDENQARAPIIEDRIRALASGG